MPSREIIYINEMERRTEEAVRNFFEYYRRQHSCAPAAHPLERSLGDWLDSVQQWMDVERFADLGKVPPLREAITTAVTDAALIGPVFGVER